ncbi:hypothetical protein ACH4MA_33790 [Streptomyces roseolus]|uniref:hypothetical protein n=1 Tax=Streptomyces roseolus TaxID=67358 RepID=UPI0037BDCEE5
MEIDYKHHGGVTEIPLYSAEAVALLPITRQSLDWHALRATPPAAAPPSPPSTPPTQPTTSCSSWRSPGSPASAARQS